MAEAPESFLSLFVADEAGTADLAARLAERLQTGDVILLEGTLGAGKTAFSRELIRALAGDPDLVVASPTFTFSQVYDDQPLQVTHFDLYRMGEPEEVFDLGWDDALADGLTLVEWPDKLGQLRPESALTLTLGLVEGDDTARQISLSGNAAWQQRLAGFSA